MGSVENFVHQVGRASDYSSTTPDAYGTIHHFRVFQQQTNQSVIGVVIRDIQAKITKRAGVYQVFWLTGKHFEKFPEILFARGRLDVFHNVELDVSVAQYFQRTIGLSSLRVVVDGDLFHNHLLSNMGL
jgi:hypothetical protein